MTEHLKQTMGLPRSGGWFRSIVENTSDVITILEADGTVRYVSPAIERMVGYVPEERVGRGGFELLHPDDLLQAKEALAEALRNPGVVLTIEVRMRHRDGSWRQVEVTGTNLLHNPSVRGIVLNWRDITERKEAEEKLHSLQQEYEELVDSVDAIIWKGEARTLRFTFVSDQAEAILGYPAKRWTTEPSFWADHIHPEDREWAVSFCTKAIADKRSHDFEYRMITADGGVAWLRDIVHVTAEDGVPTELFGVMVDVTQRKETEEALKESEERYRAVMEQSVEAIYLYDAHTKRILESNASFRRMMGFSEEELLGMEIYDFIDHDKEDIDGHVRRSLSEKRRHIGQRRYRRKDGSVILVDTSASVISYDSRTVLCALSRDVTERNQAEEVLRRSEKRFRALTQNSSDIITLLEADGTIRYESPSIERILGYHPEELVGKSAFDYVHSDDLERVLGAFAEGLAYPDLHPLAEYRFQHKDGSWRWMESVGSNLLDEPDVGELVVNSRDVTERKALEERLEHQAFHDSLTGLPNRHLFMDRLKQALRRTRRKKGRRVAVLFLDLNNFKAINDSLGHEIGDLLLTVVAQRLRRCLCPEDSLARFGGDEFVVLIEDVEGPQDTVQVAERIVGALREPFLVEGRELFVRSSIGIALGASRQKSPEDLLRDADTAMYEAKEEGLGYRVFDPAMYERAVRRLDLEKEIRKAIEQEEFRLFYQPKVRLGEPDKIAEVEALLRWEHPQKGLVMPEEFIPVAEETGLIAPIGRWVLKEACRQVKGWQEHYPKVPPLVACVNVSANQLRYPALLKEVRSALERSGIEARSLALEITESALVKDMKTSMTLLKELRDLGVRFAIDDFGSEYSSLSYLMRLPVDFVKIDKSFVWSLGEDPRAKVIVESIISLAHSLGLEAVGEGVESAEQLESLRDMGCDLVQGNYLARPLPGEEFDLSAGCGVDLLGPPGS